MRYLAFSILIFLSGTPCFATKTFSQASSNAILPDTQPWEGKSLSLITSDNDPWITPCEKNGFEKTPSYDETFSWLNKLVEASPNLKMVSLGKSDEGRDMWMVIASKEISPTPDLLRNNGKPIILAHSGIHSGEIDGKDAGLMLLRDMTVANKKTELLDKANLLFVPIFSVDGHERISPYNRPNQRGPDDMGWRTNARNLNLNRDYTKIDAPEMAAMIKAINVWKPDLYIDLHVTDGGDHQYDITFTFTSHRAKGISPSISQWLHEIYTPAVYDALEQMGHIPGQAEFGSNSSSEGLKKGFSHWGSMPRFSWGYGNLRHLPTLIVENHSLKPYRQRVLGTYALLEASIDVASKAFKELRTAIKKDEQRRPTEIPLAWTHDKSRPSMVDFKAIESKMLDSKISGSTYPHFINKPITVKTKFFDKFIVTKFVKRPKAYYIPPSYSDVIERLRIHGVQMTALSKPIEKEVTMYELKEEEFAKKPFEGRFRVTAKAIAKSRTELFPKGTVRIDMDQPLGDFAATLLEPDAADSFLQWGFFNTIFQQTEYIESYVMEPMAQRMLAEDAKLAKAFKEKLQEKAFHDSPRERYRWFYLQTPFADQRWKLYPVAREE